MVDPRIDAYIAKSADFARPILTHLRQLVHTHCPDATETIKWGMPTFEYKGGIFCHMAAFKAHCAFGFWLGDFLNIETKPDKAMGQFGCIASLADLPSDAKMAKFIREAMKLHDAGVKPSTKNNAADAEKLVAPSYFLAAIKKNKKALATYTAFTPSKKKEYVEWVVEAKTEVTRDKRLAQAVEWMSEGKVRNWKYINC